VKSRDLARKTRPTVGYGVHLAPTLAALSSAVRRDCLNGCNVTISVRTPTSAGQRAQSDQRDILVVRTRQRMSDAVKVKGGRRRPGAERN
jgi:hypothetical protein